MERKVRYFEDQIKKAELGDQSDLGDVQVEQIDTKQSSKVVIDELETKFDDSEKELLQMNSNQENLDRNYNELIELQFVLEKDAWFFDESDIQRAGQDETQLGGQGPEDEKSPLVGETTKHPKAVNLGFVTGVIAREKLGAFERVLWRATRGNMFMKQIQIDNPIKDPHSGENVEKNVFIIFFQGERAQAKIKKICESFGANLYPCPDSIEARNELRQHVLSRLEDLRVVLSRTKDQCRRTLLRVAANIQNWKIQVLKEKAIYHTMNMFDYDVGRKCLIAEGWCPITAIDEIQYALRRATERSGAIVPSILSVIKTNETPPTYYKTNKFTKAFQDIIDSYGVAHYQEVNPAVFTMITFPFLFGVMFGDLGHGFMMFCFAMFLVLRERQIMQMKLDEMVMTCFEGRYIILLMSLFAMYAGAIYNETFSLPFAIFPSQWSYNATIELPANEFAIFNPNVSAYYFGVDYNWHNAQNSLIYYNSLKMKLSVIMGITQMTLGIIISAFNAIHFRKPYNLFFEFIPQMLFLYCTFGYMCFLIIFKWLINWPHAYTYNTSWPMNINSTYGAPNLLNVMINMFESPGRPGPLYKLYPYQEYIQVVFLLIAVACVPIMLFVKPLLLRREHNKQEAYRLINPEEEHEDMPNAAGAGGHSEHGEEWDFSEIMVHQMIHTIEFVLGAVSNTASYLRLWALSLAHSELSSVFMSMVLLATLSLYGQFYAISPVLGYFQVVAILIGFAAWAFLNFSVLLMMESLSAFLHALRLHWVEFQNKFYLGDGYKFIPFSYTLILAEEN
eukprot:TRINITY_DN12348_c0_g1_i1.p1 TRINITY_DN12348_c0_g1~~TRINITY_DN12348_c0_g1_i1.p1  ORF type:complete len:868 (-),score=155.85 TRINITY_DN12348_c0_g1_i1:42-2408(-)